MRPDNLHLEAGGLQLAADDLQDVVVVPRSCVAPDNHLHTIVAAVKSSCWLACRMPTLPVLASGVDRPLIVINNHQINQAVVN
jgi:hypothetical protein